MVRHRTLTPAFQGSSPCIPTKYIPHSYIGSGDLIFSYYPEICSSYYPATIVNTHYIKFKLFLQLFLYLQAYLFCAKLRGRSTSELMQEYSLTKTSINTWLHQYANSGSFKACDNISETEKALKAALKENKQLKMENDILKQAALILGRKDV